MSHFMIGHQVFLECTDGRNRWLTIDAVQTAAEIFAYGELLSDAEAYGLWLRGKDGSGVRRFANVPWTRAVRILASDQRQGWLILDARGHLIEFVDKGHHDDLHAASERRYPWALGATAEWRSVTTDTYGALMGDRHHG